LAKTADDFWVNISHCWVRLKVLDVTAEPVVGVHITWIESEAVLRPFFKASAVVTMSIPLSEIAKLEPAPTKAIFSFRSALAVQMVLSYQLKKKFLNSLMTTFAVLETGRAAVE